MSGGKRLMMVGILLTGLVLTEMTWLGRLSTPLLGPLLLTVASLLFLVD